METLRDFLQKLKGALLTLQFHPRRLPTQIPRTSFYEDVMGVPITQRMSYWVTHYMMNQPQTLNPRPAFVL